ncbi:uncharacterized protein LOC119611544 isoform X4 [Lucilia sericata]|uniref:uncharacterized protein LOC119611544 isoform X4 n=1 Tax=Lucilia sericata TaxID=13632 RepID=UPI0018A86A29|nr:uncharacterized protein LOC119611544 isoform X4 [Lucilia sericata]
MKNKDNSKDNYTCTSREKTPCKKQCSEINENYIKSIIHMLQQTYPKNFDAPHYQGNTLVGKQRRCFALKQQTNHVHKVRSKPSVTYHKNSLKKVPTVIRIVKRQTKATSTSDLNHKNCVLKSILKKGSENHSTDRETVVNDIDKYRVYARQQKEPLENSCLSSKKTKELVSEGNTTLAKTQLEEDKIVGLTERNEKRKLPKRKHFCKHNEPDILMENLRNAVMHSVQILMSTPCRYE